MKKIILLVLLSHCCLATTMGQSIRKNYQEMTTSEKSNLVAAFNQLRTGVITQIASFHEENFSLALTPNSPTPIHFNLNFNDPSAHRPDLDVFLAWHRRQIFEVEQAMQDINPNISIPFWDWVNDNSTGSALWNSSFMGAFDNPTWNLGRTLGQFSTLPSQSQVNLVQAETNWLEYTDGFERSTVHAGPHGWVGGRMADGDSPMDPVFYLHHGMVDKLWQEWVIDNNITSSSNLYQITSLPRYPNVNPDNIVDSKSLGVFYAEGQLAELEDYTVDNTYRSLENFYYQYTIQVGENFTVPSSKNVKFESVNQIVFKPGFHAQSGSTLLAKIDTDNNIGTSAKTAIVSSNGNNAASKNRSALKNVYLVDNDDELDKIEDTILYPNPFHKNVALKFEDACEGCSIELFDLNGATRVMKKISTNGKNAQLELSNLARGVYILKITKEGREYYSKKIIKI